MSDQGKPVVPYREFIKDDDSVRLFMRKLQKFNQMFNDLMVGGCDFTLRLEVRGNAGGILHCRVQAEDMEYLHSKEGKTKKGQ